MKNKINLTVDEKEVVVKFIRMKYPPIYKTDNTDRILFVELVEFDVCPYLLGKIRINDEQYSYIMNEYESYLMQTDNTMFDKYAQEHFKVIVKLINIFKKYYTAQ